MQVVWIVLMALVVGALVLGLAANVATSERRLKYRPRRIYGTEGADFRRSLSILLGPPLLSGNRVETLLNGDQIFPAMLTAIDAAQVSVTFETFVFRTALAVASARHSQPRPGAA